MRNWELFWGWEWQTHFFQDQTNSFKLAGSGGLISLRLFMFKGSKRHSLVPLKYLIMHRIESGLDLLYCEPVLRGKPSAVVRVTNSSPAGRWSQIGREEELLRKLAKIFARNPLGPQSWILSYPVLSRVRTGEKGFKPTIHCVVGRTHIC